MVTTIFAGIGLLLALLGWAYQLGFMGARVLRSERDIAELKQEQTRIEREFREEVRRSFTELGGKIDALPCHNPRWDKEQCDRKTF